MLEIKNLAVSIGGKGVVQNLSLSVKKGEVHLLMGPNGAGKSSLAGAIMGNPEFDVKGGVKLSGEDIGKLRPDERAKKGIFLSFQQPEEIEGVKISNFIKRAEKAVSGKELKREEMEKTSEKIGLGEGFLGRELNIGFSGGEKKRAEMFQMLSLNPKMIILDEIDSGLDVDGLKLLSTTVDEQRKKGKTFLIITHNPRIHHYINPDFVHVMVKGRIVKSGDKSVAAEIEEKGYGEYSK